MGIDPPLLAYREKIPEFRANLFPSADVNSVRRRLTFLERWRETRGRAWGEKRFLPQVLQQFLLLQVFLPSQSAHRAWKGFCHGCHNEVHYRLVCQRLRSQRLRSYGARTDCSRPRDPFGGHPGLSDAFPLLVGPFFMAQRGQRSGAVASETRAPCTHGRRTTFVGPVQFVGNGEFVGNIESGAVSSRFQAAGRRVPANRRRAIPRLR